MSKPAQPTPREIRRKSGRNQSAFWGPLGVTQSGGSRYETGRAVQHLLLGEFHLSYWPDHAARELRILEIEET